MAKITEQTIDQLQKALIEKREALRSFRFGSAGTHKRNVRAGRNLRKEIAQILTEMNARVAKEGKNK